MRAITVVISPFLSKRRVSKCKVLWTVVSATDWEVTFSWSALLVFEIDVEIRELN